MVSIKHTLKKIIPKKYYPRIVQLYLKYRYLFYLGSKFECPFCRKKFRKFLPTGFRFPILKEKKVIGGGYRHNAVCPYCYSTDRERLIYLYLKFKTNLFTTNKKIKLLHVAPERNLQNVLSSHPNIDYISADLSSPLAMIKMDITNIPYKDNFFDIIICNHVLEHVQNDYKAMSELHRVLKPGGWAILQVPISPILEKTYEDPTITDPRKREELFGQGDHVRLYEKTTRTDLNQQDFVLNYLD
jgi:hypothetical protein